MPHHITQTSGRSSFYPGQQAWLSRKSDKAQQKEHTHTRQDQTWQGYPQAAVILRPLLGASLVVQWLRPSASKVRGKGLIPSQETKTHLPHGTVKTLKKKKKK